MGYAVSGPFPKLSYFLNGYLNPEWTAALRYLHGLIGAKIKLQREAVKERRARGDVSESANSVLEMIFEREGKDSPEVMPDDEITDEIMLFLL